MAPFYPFCSWVLYKSLNSLLKRTKHRRLASQVPPWWRVYLSMQGSVLGWGEALEKEMATHSRILAWEIPRIEEAGRLPSLGSQRWTRLGGWAHTHTEQHPCLLPTEADPAVILVAIPSAGSTYLAVIITEF